jgi:hypothetical protein
MKIQLETLDKKRPFYYEWISNNKIKLYYGTEFKQEFPFDGLLYTELIQHFKGKIIRIHHHCDEESLEDWLCRKKVQTRIAQYIAPILYEEKHAKPSDKKGRISFL